METQEGKQHVTMEAEIRMIHIQAKDAKDCQGPLEVRKKQGQILSFRFQSECGPMTP